jgi:hypothetical protein
MDAAVVNVIPSLTASLQPSLTGVNSVAASTANVPARTQTKSTAVTSRKIDFFEFM